MSIYAAITYIGNTLVGTQRWGQAQISIYDSTTGLPANGNNCEVTYTQNINGVVNTYSVIVPGLSYPVYTGELSDTDTSHFFFTKFWIDSLVPGTGGPTPDPGADDLILRSVETTPESAIGANDGIVTINATSSFPAIQYSLDNVTFQSSNTFTGQPGGPGIAYVKDANGGTAQAPYTVGVIGNVLSSGPGVDLGNGNISNWNAVFNPIYFLFQRKDFEITSIADGGFGHILVNVNADLTGVKARVSTPTSNIIHPITISAGDFVYIKTTNYEGSFEVLTNNGNSLVLDCPFAADDTTGFINVNSLRPYYKVQTKITYVDPITGRFNTITSTNTPLSNGFCRADFSSFLKSLLSVKDLSDYTLVNYRDMQLSGSYTISYAEVWNGNTPSWVDITRPFYVLYAARQLGQLGGGNMQEFVPFPLGFQPAKWLTDFLNPVYSNSFPFDLSFIFSEYMVGLAPFYRITLLDINQNPLADQSIADTFLLNEDGGFQLNEDSSKFIIASHDLVDTPIVEHVGLNRLLINFIPPDLCWYFKIELKYTDSVSSIEYPLMKPIICRVADRGYETSDRPVYLRWIGLTGSWNYYKFIYNQEVSLEVSNPVLIKNFVLDWANGDTIEDVLTKNAGQKMKVMAENMSVNDIKGLQSIKYSPKVQMLVSSSPLKWQTIVIASTTSAEYETMLDAYSMNMTFNLPSINTQSQ